MSADIIQFIRRSRNVSEQTDFEQTDFPTIAFRSVVHDVASDHVDTAPCGYVVPEGGDT